MTAPSSTIQRSSPLLVTAEIRPSPARLWLIRTAILPRAGAFRRIDLSDQTISLVDTMLSERRDMAAARAFFRSAEAAKGVTPERVTTDGHGSYPRAIRTTLGRRVVHRTSAYKNNGLEQDHRGIKGRIRCMRGFKGFRSAERFCRSHDELRDFLRLRARHNQHVPATRRRRLHLRRATAALAILVAA